MTFSHFLYIHRVDAEISLTEVQDIILYLNSATVIIHTFYTV